MPSLPRLGLGQQLVTYSAHLFLHARSHLVLAPLGEKPLLRTLAAYDVFNLRALGTHFSLCCRGRKGRTGRRRLPCLFDGHKASIHLPNLYRESAFVRLMRFAGSLGSDGTNAQREREQRHCP